MTFSGPGILSLRSAFHVYRSSLPSTFLKPRFSKVSTDDLKNKIIVSHIGSN